jgi:hypothetical protein
MQIKDYYLKEIYMIYYIDSDGTKYLEAITNDCNHWLKSHNLDRLGDNEEPETLQDFKIEKTYIINYKI